VQNRTADLFISRSSGLNAVLTRPISAWAGERHRRRAQSYLLRRKAERLAPQDSPTNVQAKREIASATIPFRIPDETEMFDRLGVIHQVLHLVFNKGAYPNSGARTTGDGHPALLPDQGRARWDRQMIQLGQIQLDRASGSSTTDRSRSKRRFRRSTMTPRPHATPTGNRSSCCTAASATYAPRRSLRSTRRDAASTRRGRTLISEIGKDADRDRPL
jgi:hypothetical protein